MFTSHVCCIKTSWSQAIGRTLSMNKTGWNDCDLHLLLNWPHCGALRTMQEDLTDVLKDNKAILEGKKKTMWLVQRRLGGYSLATWPQEKTLLYPGEINQWCISPITYHVVSELTKWQHWQVHYKGHYHPLPMNNSGLRPKHVNTWVCQSICFIARTSLMLWCVLKERRARWSCIFCISCYLHGRSKSSVDHSSNDANTAKVTRSQKVNTIYRSSHARPPGNWFCSKSSTDIYPTQHLYNHNSCHMALAISVLSQYSNTSISGTVSVSWKTFLLHERRSS